MRIIYDILLKLNSDKMYFILSGFGDLLMSLNKKGKKIPK